MNPTMIRMLYEEANKSGRSYWLEVVLAGAVVRGAVQQLNVQLGGTFTLVLESNGNPIYVPVPVIQAAMVLYEPRSVPGLQSGVFLR